jgi:hypothetical protein
MGVLTWCDGCTLYLVTRNRNGVPYTWLLEIAFSWLKPAQYWYCTGNLTFNESHGDAKNIDGHKKSFQTQEMDEVLAATVRHGIECYSMYQDEAFDI